MQSVPFVGAEVLGSITLRRKSPNSKPICYHTSPDTSANSTRPCESQGHEGYYDEDGNARNGASDEKNDAGDLFATKNDRCIIEDQEKEGLR